jgi:hypothetical protein
MTGTVLKGSISVGETLELPALKLTRPVKSMQVRRERGEEGEAAQRGRKVLGAGGKRPGLIPVEISFHRSFRGLLQVCPSQ